MRRGCATSMNERCTGMPSLKHSLHCTAVRKSDSSSCRRCICYDYFTRAEQLMEEVPRYADVGRMTHPKVGPAKRAEFPAFAGFWTTPPSLHLTLERPGRRASARVPTRQAGGAAGG